MVDSANEEKARQETEACSAGEETCALQRGPKEGLEREEITEEMIEAGLHILYWEYAGEDIHDDAVNFVSRLYRVMASAKK